MTSRKKGKGKGISILTLIYLLLAILQWFSSAMPFHSGEPMARMYFLTPAFGAFLFGTFLLIPSIILIVLFLTIEESTKSGMIGAVLGFLGGLFWLGGHIGNSGLIDYDLTTNGPTWGFSFTVTLSLLACVILIFWHVVQFSPTPPLPPTCPNCGTCLVRAAPPARYYCKVCKKFYKEQLSFLKSN